MLAAEVSSGKDELFSVAPRASLCKIGDECRSDFAEHYWEKSMALAVTARLDQEFSDLLDGLRSVIQRNSDVEPGPNYPPHITLAVFEADIPADHLTERLSNLCKNMASFSVANSHFGVFPGEPAYVFLAPVVTKAFLNLHEQVVGALPTKLIHQHHACGSWVPHITLASVRENPMEALGTIVCNLNEYRGKVVGLDLVHFPPIEILESFPLSPASERFPQS
ncbi:MAG: hypothetical protein MnENMB40S_16610 [Rhizobiaceae bacterium MnEN-MB40S]|nr:MAG: hypothetical protein MnENMB40S_16610 [Rhizobiaceae bacterium MnEN-MB40S]